MLSKQLHPDVLRVDGCIESLYVYFRDDVQFKEALRFFNSAFGRVLIYVGVDDLPTAMQFVDRIDLSEDRVPSERMPLEEAQAHLFAIACKLVAFAQAGRMKLGEAIIKDALEIANQLPSDQAA